MNFSPDSVAVRISNQNRWPDCYADCPACSQARRTSQHECVLCCGTKRVSKATAKQWEPPEVPRGFCGCGCGERTSLSKKSRPELGIARGEPMRFIRGHVGPARWAPRYIERDTGYETPCWLWLHGRHTHGYGVAYVGDERIYAHRLFYEERHGPVSDGLELDHLCRTPACCNPDHLEPVTHQVNGWRGLACKLTPDQAHEIQTAPAGVSNIELGRRYGIHSATVSRVRRGLRYVSKATANNGEQGE